MKKWVSEIPTRIWISLAVLMALSVPAISQLQQSGGGGSAVTLQAGSALAGKFGVDQTTPGTTNAVTPSRSASAYVE